MFSTQDKSREPRTAVLVQALWVAIVGVAGVIVLAVLGRVGPMPADTPEFLAREYYDP